MQKSFKPTDACFPFRRVQSGHSTFLYFSCWHCSRVISICRTLVILFLMRLSLFSVFIPTSLSLHYPCIIWSYSLRLLWQPWCNSFGVNHPVLFSFYFSDCFFVSFFFFPEVYSWPLAQNLRWVLDFSEVAFQWKLLFPQKNVHLFLSVYWIVHIISRSSCTPFHEHKFKDFSHTL